MASFSDLIQSDKPVLVDFYADWCGPCKMQTPILHEISAELEGRARIVKVDVDKNKAVSHKFQIRSIPTLILFKKGKIVWRKSGLAQKNEIKTILKANF